MQRNNNTEIKTPLSESIPGMNNPLFLIANFLPKSDLLNVRCVNKQFKNAADKVLKQNTLLPLFFQTIRKNEVFYALPAQFIHSQDLWVTNKQGKSVRTEENTMQHIVNALNGSKKYALFKTPQAAEKYAVLKSRENDYPIYLIVQTYKKCQFLKTEEALDTGETYWNRNGQQAVQQQFKFWRAKPDDLNIKAVKFLGSWQPFAPENKQEIKTNSCRLF